MVKELTKENIDLIKKGCCIIDFTATWCGPCRAFAPVYEALAQEMPHVVFFKVDVDEQQELAAAHSVRSIPTLKIVKDGHVLETLVGVQHKDDLKEKIEKHCR
ncbi:MAG: thioredoxin [Chlamydiae bacterium]|nr:thioredoxin [Chlamydiota bacterium]